MVSESSFRFGTQQVKSSFEQSQLVNTLKVLKVYLSNIRLIWSLYCFPHQWHEKTNKLQYRMLPSHSLTISRVIFIHILQLFVFIIYGFWCINFLCLGGLFSYILSNADSFWYKPAYCHGAMGILVYDVTDESSSNSMYLSLDFDKWIHLDYA